MIYLIGGTPRCGKSTVARNLGKKLNISYIHTDYVASALQSKMKGDEKLTLFGEKYCNRDNFKNNDIRFRVFSSSEQIQSYKTRATWNREGIQNIILYALADKQDLILEGFHLWPKLIQEFKQEKKAKIAYIMLYKNNKKKIETGLQESKDPNDRVTQKTFKQETYPLITDFIQKFGQELLVECTQYNLESFDMSQGDSFEQNIEKIVSILERQN